MDFFSFRLFDAYQFIDKGQQNTIVCANNRQKCCIIYKKECTFALANKKLLQEPQRHKRKVEK